MYHAFPGLLRGGFVGVDIFFVLSGFLISSIILEKLHEGTFSFTEFYMRRIRRIFPALVLVLSFCLCFGWFALLPEDYKQLGKHAAGGVGFLSNFLFWNESGYFDNSPELKPLLHLWSLGIEEQFYILWPLLLYLGSKNRLNFLLITIPILALSFAINVGYTNLDMLDAAFYSPQSRCWELLTGSVLAYRTGNVGVRNKYVSNIYSIFGAFLIFCSLCIISKESSFPGWWAILPVFGSALLISAGLNAWFNRVVLSNRLLVWFGLISFPLYLWHWPLLVFTRILSGDALSISCRIAVILISVSLSYLTYIFLEKPIRTDGHAILKSWILAIMIFIVGFFGYQTYSNEGFFIRSSHLILDVKTFRAVQNVSKSYDSEMRKRSDWGTLGYDVCYQNSAEDCHQSASGKKRILVVGDSMAPDALRIVAKQYSNYQFVISSTGWCVPTKVNLKKSMGSLDACNNLNKTRFNPKSLVGIDGVLILTMSYSDTFTGFKDTPPLDSYLSFLSKNEIKNVLIFGSYLSLNTKLFDLYARYQGLDDLILNKLVIHNVNNDEELIRVANKYKVEFISIRDYACNKYHECPIFFDGIPFTWDSHHWNVEFTDFLSKKMAAHLSSTWLEK